MKIFLLLASFIPLFALNTKLITKDFDRLDLSGFADIYYLNDFNNPEQKQRHSFFFNHNRDKEIDLNIALLQLDLQKDRFRSTIALQKGSYVEDNYQFQDNDAKHFYEASVGLALDKEKKWWLDAGIFPSHISFEVAPSLYNFTPTSSLGAENTPEFSTGAKLTYMPNKHWELMFVVENGWERIKRVEGDSSPSIGTQVLYKATQDLHFNWGTFIGSDDPDSQRRMRYFNNFYLKYRLSERIRTITGFDIGLQQKAKHSESYSNWIAPIAIVQYEWNPKLFSAFRAEYYKDKDEVSVVTLKQEGLKTAAFSINVDYAPIKNINLRLEARYLRDQEKVFMRNHHFVNDNFFITTSMGLRFSSSLK